MFTEPGRSYVEYKPDVGGLGETPEERRRSESLSERED